MTRREHVQFCYKIGSVLKVSSTTCTIGYHKAICLQSTLIQVRGVMFAIRWDVHMYMTFGGQLQFPSLNLHTTSQPHLKLYFSCANIAAHRDLWWACHQWDTIEKITWFLFLMCWYLGPCPFWRYRRHWDSIAGPGITTSRAWTAPKTRSSMTSSAATTHSCSSARTWSTSRMLKPLENLKLPRMPVWSYRPWQPQKIAVYAIEILIKLHVPCVSSTLVPSCVARWCTHSYRWDAV